MPPAFLKKNFSISAICLLFLAGVGFSEDVEVSTATGDKIEFDNQAGTAVIEGNARIESSTATIQADRIKMNMNTKEAQAQGHVVVEQSSGTLRGDAGVYNWETSTGVISNATGVSPPWRYSADQIIQRGPRRLTLIHGNITSCEADPPHYHIDASRGNVLVGKRAKLKNARLVTDELPIFWTPFYTRSLVPKEYTLRIEPGHTSRDGLTVRSILGYPFTPNTRTKLRWDYLQRTGNGAGLEHEYFLPSLKGSLDSYYIRDINPDPQPQTKRYSILWNHYQRLLPALTLNSRVDFKSDQTFGNQFQDVGNLVRVENQIRGLLSEAGLNYQFSKASLQAQFDRRDKFDSTVSSSSFISKLTLPRLTLNTSPLSWKQLPFYTSFSANFTNETLTREDPDRALRYQRSASLGTQIRRDIKLNRNLTFTPVAGYSQTWQDRLLTSTTSEKDVYFGRYNLGGNVRQRAGRSTDLNLNYQYMGRLRQNQTLLDSFAADHGIESNQLNASVNTWLRGNDRLTLSSGYDLRDVPRDAPQKYKHLSERFTPPSLDLQWELARNVLFNFRETYGLFDPVLKVPRRTPINTSGEIQIGQISRMTYVTQGFSYTKPPEGQESEIVFNNKLKFFLTPKWYLDFFLSYRAVGEKLDYRKAFPIERTLRIVRDLHCWILRMDFSSRPGVQEASFYIDMKTNLTGSRNIFASNTESSFYTYREEAIDVSKVFPAPPESN